MIPRRLVTAVLLAIGLLLPGSAAAQGGATSLISGTVVDSDGAAVPGASVTVRNDATGTQFETVTTGTGTFAVPALDAGTYTVTVTLSGFKTAVLNGVRVVTGTPASVQATLQVGQLEETVVVSGRSELVQTQATAVSTTVLIEQLTRLPLVTRNALNALPMLAGVDAVAGPRDATINGLPQSAINVTIDGVNVNNNLQSGDGFYSMIRPQMDAVEEVTVTGAAAGAESSGQGAVSIRFVTRSGTNRYDGSLYYYLRHPSLNSNYWFNTRNGLPRSDVVVHQTGGRVGGPISVPGLFDGRNKAFFFFNYEEFRQPTEATRTRTILTPDAQQGMFAYNSGSEVRRVNLLALGGANGETATLDPTVAAVLARIRTATAGSGSVSPTSSPNTLQYVFQSAGDGLERLPTGRVDVNLGSAHRFSATYNWQQVDRLPDLLNGSDVRFPGFANYGEFTSSRTAGSTALRSTLRPTLVNELRAGWQWSPLEFYTNVSAAQFADQGGFSLGMTTAGTDFASLTSATTTTGPSSRNTTNWNIDDTLSWLRGAHSLSFGGNFTRVGHTQTNWTAAPALVFGVDASNDPAARLFTTANFPGASTGQLNSARALYGLVTGRVTAVNGTARLSESSNRYEYLGATTQRGQMDQVGLFAQDAWRVTPALTLNYGLRWEIQRPFTPRNDSYAAVQSFADICGVSGPGDGPAGRGCNLFAPGTLTGAAPQLVQYSRGARAYDTDWNNLAPNLGAAWRPQVTDGWLRQLLGEPDQAVVRAGFSVAYSRVRMDEFTSVFGGNPGNSFNANRNVNAGNLVYPGESWPLLLRDDSRLGPPTIPDGPAYPLSPTLSENLNAFEPGIQVPRTRSWSVGLQRALSRDMAVEIRYVGTRLDGEWLSENWNEVNLYENAFLEEFGAAQANLRANLAAGRGASFRYFGPGTGTAPLPIYLAYFTGAASGQAADPARYANANFASAARLGELALWNPTPEAAATALMNNATFRANALAAGLPANFFVLNPSVTNANVNAAVGRSRYDALQVELRRRLAHGLSLNASYTFSGKDTSTLDTLRRERRLVEATGAQGVIPHAFKLAWTWQVPAGTGRTLAGGSGPLLNGLIGGWEVNGAARVQSGRRLSLSNVRLVGMNQRELQEVFRIRIDPETRTVYTLPQDIIDNTVRAFSTDPASASGYSALGAPAGRYLAPASTPDCLVVIPGECGIAPEVFVTGPVFSRVDLSIRKRLPIAGGTFAEIQFDLLNAFDAVNFTPVFQASNSLTINQVTAAYQDINNTFDPGGRIGQLVFRLSW